MFRVLVAAVLLCALGGGSALHAQSYPDRTIKLVVPFPAGGATDNAARLVAQRLQAALGQSVIIENQAGAGGTIGTKQAAIAAPPPSASTSAPAIDESLFVMRVSCCPGRPRDENGLFTLDGDTISPAPVQPKRPKV